MNHSLKIIGVDPGLAKTGLGIIEITNDNSLKLIDWELIETESCEDLPKRLLKIYNKTLSFIERNSPQECGIEEIFFSKNAKSAFLVGQARGTTIVAISKKNIPIYEYTPIQVKQAICGYGRGEKEQLRYIVEKILNLNSETKSTRAQEHKSTSQQEKGNFIASGPLDSQHLACKVNSKSLTTTSKTTNFKYISPHVIDALSIAICHANSRKMQNLINK